MIAVSALAALLAQTPAYAADKELRVLFVANYLFHHQNPYYTSLKGMLAEGGMKRPVLIHVVGELAERGKAGVPHLANAVLGTDKYFARSAARVLGSIGATAADARAPLIKVLAVKDRHLADLAEKSLGRIAAASPDTVAALQRTAGDKDAKRAVRAAGALANAGAKHEASAAKALVTHLRNPSETVAKESMSRALSLAQRTRAASVRNAIVSGLIAALKHQGPDIRRRAAQSLGVLGPAAKAAVPTLQEAILTGASCKKEAIAAIKRIQPGRKVNTKPGLDAGDEDDELDF